MVQTLDAAPVEQVYSVPEIYQKYVIPAGFLDAEGFVAENFKEFLRVLYKHGVIKEDVAEKSPGEINAQLQTLLRAKGLERWHMDLDSDWSEEIFKELVPCIENLQFFKEQASKMDEAVDLLVIFAGRIWRGFERIGAALDHLRKGGDVKNVAILATSSRVLKDKNQTWEDVENDPLSEFSQVKKMIESAQAVDQSVKEFWLKHFEDLEKRNEAEMMHALWDCYADAPIKDRYKVDNQTLILLDAPNRGTGTNGRGITEDTVNDLLEQRHDLKSFRVIAEHPHVRRMLSILIKATLENRRQDPVFSYHFQPATRPDQEIKARILWNIIDAIAREFYEDLQFVTKLQKLALEV